MQEPEEKDDVVIEPEVKRSDLFTNGEEGEAESKIAKMREELAACRKESREYMDGWQRAKADYVNALKRFGEDAKASELRGRIKAVETLLPAFNALERAKEHGEIPEGFMAIAKQIETSFATLGLEEVGKLGELFNPELHEALGQELTENAVADNTITAVLEKGWRVNGTVIRPAKVRVARYRSEA